MAYSGEVTVGGPADVREVPGLRITKVAVGDFNNDCYLLRCTATGEQLLIDAAAEPEVLLGLVGDDGLTRVVTTHQHGDHWQGLDAVVAATGAITAAGRRDAGGIPVPTQELLDEGDVVRVGAAELSVLELVGHTPGSVALLYRGDPERPHLFTGDCLFPGGVGNTQADPERFARLLGDVETKVFGRLPDETWVYPGHGADTTLGAERPHLSQWRERGW